MTDPQRKQKIPLFILFLVMCLSMALFGFLAPDDQFSTSHKTPLEEITLDFDATDDAIHGNQVGRFTRTLPNYGFWPRHPTRLSVAGTRLPTTQGCRTFASTRSLGIIADLIKCRPPDKSRKLVPLFFCVRHSSQQENRSRYGVYWLDSESQATGCATELLRTVHLA